MPTDGRELTSIRKLDATDNLPAAAGCGSAAVRLLSSRARRRPRQETLAPGLELAQSMRDRVCPAPSRRTGIPWCWLGE
jgi:hypothetical protein